MSIQLKIVADGSSATAFALKLMKFVCYF